MTAAEFVEKLFNIELHPYRKELINKVYEAEQKCKAKKKRRIRNDWIKSR